MTITINNHGCNHLYPSGPCIMLYFNHVPPTTSLLYNLFYTLSILFYNHGCLGQSILQSILHSVNLFYNLFYKGWIYFTTMAIPWIYFTCKKEYTLLHSILHVVIAFWNKRNCQSILQPYFIFFTINMV